MEPSWLHVMKNVEYEFLGWHDASVAAIKRQLRNLARRVEIDTAHLKGYSLSEFMSEIEHRIHASGRDTYFNEKRGLFVVIPHLPCPRCRGQSGLKSSPCVTC